MPAFTITQKIHPISPRYVVADDTGAEICHVRKKGFRLKDELVFWADADETRPWARLKERSLADFVGAYDITDEAEQPIGAIRRAGMRSMLRGTWEIAGPDGEALATVQEDSLVFALLRRARNVPLPVAYTFTAPDGTVLGTHKRRMGLRDVYDLQVDGLDPRLAIAQGIALDLLEGR